MANTFEIPLVQPLRFFRQTDLTGVLTTSNIDLSGFSANYNSRPFDGDFFMRNLKDWQDQVIYVQPFQKGDKVTIYNRYDNTYSLTDYTINILDCEGTVIKTIISTDTEFVSVNLGGVYAFSYDILMWDLEEGIYYAQMSYVSGAYKEFVISEPFEVANKHKGTALLTYTNSYNALNVLFDYASISFQLRVHAAMVDMNPKAKVETYEDQPLSQTLLSGRPYREWNWIVGGNGNPVPDYMADKVTRALCTDTLQIDDTLYTISEDGVLEANRTKNYPLSEWSITLRDKVNPDSVEVDYFEGYDVNLGQMPLSDRFYLYAINVLGTPQDIEQQFTSKDSFISFLQNWFITNYALDVSVVLSSENQILVIAQDEGSRDWLVTNAPTLNGLLENWLGLEIDTASSPTLDFQSTSSFYTACYWGDGNQTTYATGTSTSNAYTADGIKKCYFYFNDQVTLNVSDTPSSDSITTLDGQIVTTLTELTIDNNALKFVNNQLLLQGDGSFNLLALDGDKLTTAQVNKIIVMVLDAVLQGKIASSGSLGLDLQSPSAPPSSGSMAAITAQLRTYWTVTTD